MTSTIWSGTTAVPGCAPGGSPIGRDSVVFTEPAWVDLYIYRGDSGRFQVQIVLLDGTFVNLTGATWDCDVRASADDPTVITSLPVSPVDAYTIEIRLPSATSAGLSDEDVSVWDLEMTLNGEVATVMRGNVFVTKDVSRQ
jgi:hypothetical protein